MIVLASTSPQRRAILEQLEIPFRVVAPDYEETGDDPVEHAAGKARSVDGGGDPVLGVDTVVVCDGVVLGKPVNEQEASEMLSVLAGRTHEVISGLCLRTGDREELAREVTEVTFRPPPRRRRDRRVRCDWGVGGEGRWVRDPGVRRVARRAGRRRLPERRRPPGRAPRLHAQVGEHRLHAPVVRRPGGELELAQDMADVRLDRLAREPEALCDPAIREPLGHQAQGSRAPGA